MNGITLFVVFRLLSIVLTYTVVLKPVKHSHPSVKVYRYELRYPKILVDGSAQFIHHKSTPAQRLYPIVIKPHKNRGQAKKQYPARSSNAPENVTIKEPRYYNLPQQLVPPVSNQIEESSESKEEKSKEQVEEEVRPVLLSPQEEKSFSSFGQDKGRIYKNPGEWAKPAVPLSVPVPASTEPANATKPVFRPSQLYLQIRHKNTVIHVPQTEALNDAETLEELINAPRLKELARTTHVQETYSEEGYEDAGYDHAGQIRHAQHGEVYDAKDEGKFQIKEPPLIIDYDSDLDESKKIHSKKVSSNNFKEKNEKEKPEPRIKQSPPELSKNLQKFADVPPNYKGSHKYSSRVKAPLNFHDQHVKEFNFTRNRDQTPNFPSYFGELPPPFPPPPLLPQNTFINESSLPLHVIADGRKSTKYMKEHFNSTKIYPVTEQQAKDVTEFEPHFPVIDTQASPSAKSVKYSKIYSKKTKQLKLEPYKVDDIYIPPPPPPSPPLSSHKDLQLSVPRDATDKEESINHRIVLPTIGYINSLTTAYFGKSNEAPFNKEPKTQLTNALNLTQVLDYLRSNKKIMKEVTQAPTESDIRTFEPMKLKKTKSFVYKIKRDVYMLREREKRSESSVTESYEGNDESDEPHNEKNKEIIENERQRIKEENKEKEQYEKDLREEISKKEKEILKETYKNIGVEEDVSELFPDLPESYFEKEEAEISSSQTEVSVDVTKYPYYFMKKLPENSALRYASNQKTFPRKSGYKMEFYDSRESVIQCPDFHPDLDNLPDSNSTEYSDDQAGENQRLSGVGDKIMCLRSKYFDPDPFDNPIFREKEIDYVGKPKKNRKMSQGLVKSNEPQRTNDQSNQKSKLKIQKSMKPSIGRIKFKSNHSDPIKEVSNSNQDKVVSPKIQKSPDWRGFEITYEIPTNVHLKQQNQTNSNDNGNISRNKIFLEFNCLPIIGKLTALDGKKNLTIECKDTVLEQKVIKDISNLRIIPKPRAQSAPKNPVETDWVPIVGHKRSHRFDRVSRKTDEVKLVKDETDLSSSSNLYVIDELKEDENVRKGEVVEDMDHYWNLMKVITTAEPKRATGNVTKTPNTARKRRDLSKSIKIKRISRQVGSAEITQTQHKPFETKRPLKRLSGLDFLTRYHKNKSRSQGKTADFWKVSETTTRQNISQTTESIKPLEKKATELKNNVNRQIVESLVKKSEPKKVTQARKVPQSNIVPEKVTKKPETKVFRNIKAEVTTKTENNFSNTTEKAIRRPGIKTSDYSESFSTEETVKKTNNLTRFVTKVSREISETSEKPRIVLVKSEEKMLKTEKDLVKPESVQYKTIARIPSAVKKSEAEEVSRNVESTDTPILYYVVDTSTGIGKWITNYEETRKSGKLRKVRKPDFRSKNNKRRKKSKTFS